jgi:hypothetical protein
MTTQPDPMPARSFARPAAVAVAILLAGLSVFEIALAAGAPWGAAAFGGASAVLEPALRVTAGVFAVVWAAAALVVLRRAGHPVWAPLPRRALPVAVWVLAGYMALGVLTNSISPSTIERAIRVPATIAMSALCFGIAFTLRRRRATDASER